MTPLQQMIARVRNAHAMAAPSDVVHVTLFTNADGNARATTNGTTRDVSPPDADDSLHPWERDLVTNGAPFARPSNRVQS